MVRLDAFYQQADLVGMPIDLNTWTTPNGRNVSIMLEELALPCTAHKAVGQSSRHTAHRNSDDQGKLM